MILVTKPGRNIDGTADTYRVVERSDGRSFGGQAFILRGPTETQWRAIVEHARAVIAKARGGK